MPREIHPTAQIHPLALLDDSERGSRLVIGASAVIDAFVRIKMAGGAGDVAIGARSYINSGCVLYSGNGIKIGNDVLIAANCTLAPVNHAFGDIHRTIREQGFAPSRGGILIRDDVWIGANTVILDGADIGMGCVIAAGSVVHGVELDHYFVYGGNPLRKLKNRRGKINE